MKYLLLLITFLLAFSYSYAQEGGMRVSAGIASLENGDKVITPEGTDQTGYYIGVDGRLFRGRMSFLVGARYTSVSKIANEDFVILGNESVMSFVNGRVGLDFSIISFGELFRVRTKLLASFDVSISESLNPDYPAGYALNDGWLSGVTGLGVDIGPVVVDFEYKLGALNAYYKKKDALYNSWTLGVGVFF